MASIIIIPYIDGSLSLGNNRLIPNAISAIPLKPTKSL